MKKAIIAVLVVLVVFLLNIKNLTAQDSTGTVTDIDGNVYQTVVIGNQEWMAENLKVTHYRNGDAIPNVTGDSLWISLTTGAYCTYDNDSSNADTYGHLYNWFAVNDSLGIAPEGWHVATDAEWTELVNFLGGEAVAGGKLKEAGESHWLSPNTGATNESGFTALAGGIRYLVLDGFSNMGYYTRFWSSNEIFNSNLAWNRLLYWDRSDIFRGYDLKNYGYSVRCVNDVTPTGVSEGQNPAVVKAFKLFQNYPNPFNPETIISFELPKTSVVSLIIYDVLGREIKTLISGQMSVGLYGYIWDGKNNAGNQVNSGIYIYRFYAGDFTYSRKMILIR